MFNDLSIYYECGLKSGKAAKVQDWSLANFERSWLQRALNLEKGDDKATAKAEYDRGYRECAKHTWRMK